ncbi:MAG: hypothetical protein IT438_04055 [Phycisphaerales bacterium]|nr:hypothetical protein [Phycisphaerales bacterium]
MKTRRKSSGESDPVFWLLHSFIDLCWARWECEKNDGTIATFYDYDRTVAANANHDLNDPMDEGAGETGAWGLRDFHGGVHVKPADVINFVAMGFTYEYGGAVLGAPGGTCKGSCCNGAACTTTTQANCAAPAIWSAIGVCTPNPCPALVGSCCACTGTCSITTQAGCTGAWTRAGACVPDPCAVPPNDACANAIALALGAPATGVNCGSSADGPNGTCGGVANTTTVWWKFTPAATGSYQVNTCGSTFDTVLEVYSGGCGAPVSVVGGCNDDSSSNTPCPSNSLHSRIPAVTLTAGTTYLVRVRGFNALTGAIAIIVINNNPLGVCCNGAACTLTDSATCTAPSAFTPGGAYCTPNPCSLPTGSCCAPDGACSVTTAPACPAASPWTSGASCTPNPCPQPTGACCCGSSCTLSTAAACAGLNRTFSGTGTACTPFSITNPCCRGNYNKSAPGPGAPGGISVQDIFDFLGGYFSGNACANTNDSTPGPGAPNGVSVQDIFDFLAAYFGGCP